MTLRLSERSEFLTMIYLSVQHQNKRNRKPKFNIQNTVLNYNLFSIDIARHITAVFAFNFAIKLQKLSAKIKNRKTKGGK